MSGDSKTQKNGSRDVCRERWMCLNGKSGRRGVTGCLGSVHRDRLHSPNLSCIIRDGPVAGEFTHARRLIGTYGSSFLGPDRRGILFSGTRRMLQNQPAPYTDRRRRGRPLCLPFGTGDHRGSPLQIFAKLNHYSPIIFIGIRRRIYSIEDQAGHTSNALGDRFERRSQL